MIYTVLIVVSIYAEPFSIAPIVRNWHEQRTREQTELQQSIDEQRRHEEMLKEFRRIKEEIMRERR